MNTTRTLSAALFCTALALAAPTQAQPATGAPALAAGTMTRDCAKPMAKHDHSAEKGNPKPAATADGCPRVKAKSTLTAASAAERNRLKHLHARDGK